MCCSWVINDYVFFKISVTLTIDLFPWYFSTMQVYNIRPKLNEVIVWYWAVDTHIHTQTNTSITITSLCEIKYGPILTTLYIVKSHRSGTEHHTNTRLVPRYSWKRRQVILGFDIGYGHTFCSPYWWWRCYLARLGILWNMHFNLKRTRALAILICLQFHIIHAYLIRRFRSLRHCSRRQTVPGSSPVFFLRTYLVASSFQLRSPMTTRRFPTGSQELKHFYDVTLLL